MRDHEIRTAIRATFRPAEQIWGDEQSPFAENSAWIGYLKNKDESRHVAAVTGFKVRPFAPEDEGYEAVVHLIRDLLPEEGRELFITGYNLETIYVDPPPTIWTPSPIAITMATDPYDDDRMFALITIFCGQPSPTSV